MSSDGRAVPRRIFWDGTRRAPAGWDDLSRIGPSELARDGLPFAAAEAALAYVGPALGQVPFWELAEVLAEFRRVLRPGATIRVATYDLHLALAAYSSRDDGFFWERPTAHLSGALAEQLMGSGSARSLHTADTVVELLEQAGFAQASARPFGVSAADPLLAEIDTLETYCSYVEAAVVEPWPVCPEQAGPSGVHLALGDTSGATMQVLWRGPAGSVSHLRYRAADDPGWIDATIDSWLTIDGDAGPAVFRAFCDGLEPERLHQYEITLRTDGESSGASGSFTAPPGVGTGSARLAFIADTGVSGRADGLSDATARVIDALIAADPIVVLAGGDYAYRSSDRRWASAATAVHAWLDAVEPLAKQRALMVQYGNHEVELAERYRDWAVHFPRPRGSDSGDVRSYSFDVGPCHISAFYAPTGSIDPAEVSWLWQDLSDARLRQCPWLVVYQHQPLFAHGSSHPAEPTVARALARVLDAHRVDLHLSAHDQNYERTFPLRWEQASTPRPVSGACNRYRKGDGTVCAKVSPAGKRSDRGSGFSILPSDRAEVIAAADDTAHHFAIIDIDAAALWLRVYAIDDDHLEAREIDALVVEA